MDLFIDIEHVQLTAAHGTQSLGLMGEHVVSCTVSKQPCLQLDVGLKMSNPGFTTKNMSKTGPQMRLDPSMPVYPDILFSGSKSLAPIH